MTSLSATAFTARRNVSEEIPDHLDHLVLHPGLPPSGGFSFSMRNASCPWMSRARGTPRRVRSEGSRCGSPATGMSGRASPCRKEMIRNFTSPFERLPPAVPRTGEVEMSIAFVMHRYELASNRRSKTKDFPLVLRSLPPKIRSRSAVRSSLGPLPLPRPPFAAQAASSPRTSRAIFRSER